MGLVIFAGLGIGTLPTLFLVPAMYMFAGSTDMREAIAKAPGPEIASGALQFLRGGTQPCPPMPTA